MGYNTDSNKKNQKIQMLRGLAICAVVIIHSYPHNLFGVYLRVFVNFAVSLFFFLSGYLTKLENDNWVRFCIKRIKRVIIPYLIWSMVYTVLSRNFDDFLFKILTGKCIVPFYYVFVYVQFVILTPFVSKLAKSKFRWVGWFIQPVSLLLLGYLGLGRYVKISLFLTWFGPYYLGLVLGNHILHWKHNYKTTGVLWLVSVVFSIIEGLIWYKIGNYDKATTQGKLTNCVYSFACLLIAYKFIIDDKLNPSGIMSRTLTLLGDYSFGIFLSHILILKILYHLPKYDYLFFPINSVLVIVISSFCVFCGRRLLGEKYGRILGLY